MHPRLEQARESTLLEVGAAAALGDAMHQLPRHPPRIAGGGRWRWRGSVGIAAWVTVAAGPCAGNETGAAEPRAALGSVVHGVGELLPGGRQAPTAIGDPDPGPAQRPIARWTFDDALQTPDVENHHDMTTIPHSNAKLRVPDSFSHAQGICRTSSAVALPAGRFTVTGFLSLGLGTGPFTLFEKRGPGGQAFSIQVTPEAELLRVELKNGDGRLARFDIDNDGPLAFYAFVVDVEEPRVLRYSLHTHAITVYRAARTRGEPPGWGRPGIVQLGCTVPAIGDVVVYDDIAIWDRAIAEPEFLAMARRYQATAESLPPRSRNFWVSDPGASPGASVAIARGARGAKPDHVGW